MTTPDIKSEPLTILPPRKQGRPPNVIRPLSPAEYVEAEQIGRRLHDELREALALVTSSTRGASAMSRNLDLDRATCQRLVAATSQRTAGPETLVQLPGVNGLRLFLQAIVAKGFAESHNERLASAAAAIDRFEQFLGDIGGSQRLLRQRLEERVGPEIEFTRDRPEIASREALFNAAAQITGRRSRVSVTTSIIRPLPTDGRMTEAVRLRAILGHSWSNPAVPLEIGQARAIAAADAGASFSTLDATPAVGNTPGSLLAPFCSQPLPKVIGRATAGRVTYVVDAAQSDGSTPIDVVMAHRAAAPDQHPATMRPAIGEVWAMQNLPAQHLVFDVFIHIDIARRCIPSLELHLLTPSEPTHLAARWSTRCPVHPRLEVLGPGLGATGTPAYPRYGELLEHVFTQIHWDPSEFVGYRCEVEYPVWRADYGMLFDFTGAEL